MRILHTAVLYFLFVFGAGFVLGIGRVLFLVPLRRRPSLFVIGTPSGRLPTHGPFMMRYATPAASTRNPTSQRTNLCRAVASIWSIFFLSAGSEAI